MFHIHLQFLFLLFYRKQLFQSCLVDTYTIYDQNKYDWICSHLKNLYIDLSNDLTNIWVQTDIQLLNPINLKKKILLSLFVDNNY